MSQDLVLFQDESAGNQLPAAFEGLDNAADLSDGIGGSYAILSMKGSRFQVKYQGSTTLLTNSQTGDPIGSFEAVIIKGNPNITKQFYLKGFSEGDTSAPDCFSLDGKVPADSVPVPQNSVCATCPQNAFGSRVNPTTGAKSKACSDNRKLAVSPLGDIDNELLGGPMLFRVPATALRDLAMFSDTLKARGFPYNAVAVRISFDTAVSYPKPVFRAIRPLTNEEAEKVLTLYKSDHVEKVLAEFSVSEGAAPKTSEPAEDQIFEQVQAAPEKPAAPRPTPKPAQAPPPVVKPTPPKAAPAAAKVVAKAPAAPAARPTPVKAKLTPVEGEPVAEDTSTEAVPGNLEDDIAGILADLNSIASE